METVDSTDGIYFSRLLLLFFFSERKQVGSRPIGNEAMLTIHHKLQPQTQRNSRSGFGHVYELTKLFFSTCLIILQSL